MNSELSQDTLDTKKLLATLLASQELIKELKAENAKLKQEIKECDEEIERFDILTGEQAHRITELEEAMPLDYWAEPIQYPE